jgi:hypothetical protein
MRPPRFWTGFGLDGRKTGKHAIDSPARERGSPLDVSASRAPELKSKRVSKW